MKKRTIGKRVAIVALSSVLAVGALSALAGCGNNSATTMSVTIFCNKSDEQTNKAIMNNWAKRYAEENNLGFDIKIDAIVKYDKGDYFTELNKAAGEKVLKARLRHGSVALSCRFEHRFARKGVEQRRLLLRIRRNVRLRDGAAYRIQRRQERVRDERRYEQGG